MADNSLEDYTPEQVAQMAATYNSLVNNPATREITLRATKHINPNLSVPELEIKDANAKAAAKAQEKIDALENKIREQEVRQRINDARSGLKSQGFSADDVAAIEKIMTDEGIASYETASKYYKGQQVSAEPTPQAQHQALTYSMPKDPMAALKNGSNGLKTWGREQAASALDDLRAGRIKLNS